MKISSASKKVLASALSAAMVVAFAPTVAFGATQTATAQVVFSGHLSSGKAVEFTSAFYDLGETAGATNAMAALNAGNPLPTVIGQNEKGADIEGYMAVASGKINLYAADQVDDDGKLKTDAVVTSSYAFDTAELDLLSDVTAQLSYSGNVALTVDLNGHTLTNVEKDVNASATAAADALTETSSADVTVANGTIEAKTVKKADDSKTSGTDMWVSDAVDSNSNGKLVLENVTVKAGTVNAANGATVKGGAYGVISAAGKTVTFGTAKAASEATTGAITGSVVVEKASKVSVSASNDKADVTAVDGKVELKEAAELSVKAESAKKSVTAIDASEASEGIVLGKDSKLTADATSAGVSTKAATASDSDVDVVAAGVKLGNNKATVGSWTSDKVNSKAELAVSATETAATNTKAIENAVAVSGDVDVVNGTLTAAAKSVDADASAAGVKGAVTVGEHGDAQVSASAIEDDNAVAATLGAVAAGTFTGKTTFTGAVTGGKFTSDPKSKVDTDNFEIVDDGTYYTVQRYAGYQVAGSAQNLGTVALDGVENLPAAVANALNGKAGAAKLSYTEGNSLESVQKLALTADKVKVYYKVTKYSEKTATDAQKATAAAIKDWATANKVAVDTIYVPTVFVGYMAKNSDTEPTVLANFEDFGSSVSGRNTSANVLTVDTVSDSYIKMYGAGYVVAYGTTASELKATVDSKDKTTPNHFELTAPVSAYAEFALDLSALDKGDKPDTPAAEKATQGIDVDQKSKTVKLAKKAAKTKKAASFNLGATAQTGLTIAKASGSSKVTVSSNGKVTLKKGAKKGTYKATVTINAAATDAYYAAAKTVTVKFVVKK